MKKGHCNRNGSIWEPEGIPGSQGCYGMEEETACVFTEEELQDWNQRELLNYEAKVPMTPAEKRVLRKWVGSGHSVYENPDSRYICLNGAWPPPDFLSVYRMDKEIRKALKGKTKAERMAYLKSYTGYDDEPYEEREKKEASEKSPEQFKEQIRKLKRELFHIWDFIGQEGLWSEAQEYMERNRNEPMPFEDFD